MDNRKRLKSCSKGKLLEMMMVLFFLTGSNIFAQNKPITLKMNDVGVEEVLSKIRTDFSYRLLFNHEEIKAVEKVTLDVKNASIEAVLNTVLKNSSLSFKVKNGVYVIVSEGKKPDQSRRLTVVTGNVLDEKGCPLLGANVVIKGSTVGTQTDEDGVFTISVLPKDILMFLYMGYKPESVIIAENQAPLTIKLLAVPMELSEAMVTGIFKKAEQSYTGAAIRITSEELKQGSNRNLVHALYNIDPSFRLIENNLAGSDPNNLEMVIQIRGNNNLPTGTQLTGQSADLALQKLNRPLIILDDFEITLEKMITMNESEVESITILKDASATAMYGSRGTNGVVVITSKRPTPGKLRMLYSGSANIEVADLTSYSLLNAREKLDLEYKMGYYDVKDDAIRDQQLKSYYNFLLNEVNRGVNTYWLSQPIRTGVGQRHNLRLEGGDAVFRYSGSFQVNNIQGVMKGSEQKHYNGNVQFIYSSTRFKFSNSLMVSEGRSSNSPYGSFETYVKLNPYWRAYDEKGQPVKLLGDSGYFSYLVSRIGTLPFNPLYDATLKGFSKRRTSGLTNNTSLEWTIVDGLTVRGRLAIAKNIAQTDEFRPAEHTEFASYRGDNVIRKGWYKYGITNDFSYSGSLNLSYSKRLGGKHIVFAGLDASINEKESSSNNFKVEGIPNSDLDIVGAAVQYAKNERPSGTKSISRFVGFTGNLSYSYADRYFVDGALCLDGSSQFGSECRFTSFWSLGAGWNLHKESFMVNQNVIERLKLRASMGTTGSQNFASDQSIMTYEYVTSDRYYYWNGVTLKTLGNEYLKWQQTYKYNVGMDAEFLQGKLKIGADIYLQQTGGLVSSISLPASSGFPFYTDNIGSIENRGYELRATMKLIHNMRHNIYWNVTTSAAHNRNKITRVSQVIKDAQKKLEETTGVPPMTSYREGYSTSTIWLVPSLGIDPGTGKELFMGRNGVPTYIWDARDVIAAGSTNPKVEGNISSQFYYKAFALNVIFGYWYGGQEYNQTLLDKVEVVNYTWNVDRRVYTDRWQKIGDHTAFKALQVNEKTPKTSRFLQDNNTFTCSNINMQYSLNSKKVIKSLGVETVSFSVTIADVFYLSTIKRERGINYPYSRQFSFGLNVTF